MTTQTSFRVQFLWTDQQFLIMLKLSMPELVDHPSLEMRSFSDRDSAMAIRDKMELAVDLNLRAAGYDPVGKYKVWVE